MSQTVRIHIVAKIVCVCACACVRVCMLCACTYMQLLSRVQLFTAPWTLTYQPRLSLKFSRLEYWSSLPFPVPGDLPDPRVKPQTLKSPALASRFFTTASPGLPSIWLYHTLFNHSSVVEVFGCF